MTEMQYIGEAIFVYCWEWCVFFFYVSVIWFYFIPFVSYCLLYFYSLLYPSPKIKMSICTFTFSTISNSRHIKISFHMDLSVIAIILHVCIYYIWVLNAAFFFALYCSGIWFTTSSDSEPMVKWAFMIKICMCGLVFLSHFRSILAVHVSFLTLRMIHHI